MAKLKSVPVLFDQRKHTYTNQETGKALKGITGTLIHKLFPDKYKDIPQAIMDKAAARGSTVHEDIELAESLGVAPTTVEAKNYFNLKSENGLKYLDSEYMVTDFDNYASQIDVVFEVDKKTVDIGDFKTTSKFDKDSVSWQLSIYAYFLEIDNPGIKVRNLYGIWLRGGIARLIPVERRSVQSVKGLMKADIDNIPFDWSPDFPDYITDNEERIAYLADEIKRLSDEYDKTKGEILQKMIDNKDKSFDTGKLLITVTAPSVRETFDSKKFRADHEDLYSQYKKTSETKESLKITIR